MTYNCENVLYHYRHTAFILFMFCFSYFYYLYQAYLFCRPFEVYRNKKLSQFKSLGELEIFESIIFTLGFIIPLWSDYYLIRPSLGVTICLYLYFLYQRYSFNYNIILVVFFDFFGFLIVYYFQINCFVLTLVIFRLIFEGLKLITTVWANNTLRIMKSGGVHLIGLSILIGWIFFYIIKR